MSDPIFQEEDSQLYIRPKPGGGRVFRVTLRADQQRLDMTYLTQVSLPDGRLHDRGATRPTPDERAQIADWVAAQSGAKGGIDHPLQSAARAMQAAAEWLDTTATPADASAASDDIFAAMNDLRNALLWRISTDDSGS